MRKVGERKSAKASRPSEKSKTTPRPGKKNAGLEKKRPETMDTFCH